MAAAAFFAKLPPGRLSPAEAELREHLLGTAAAAKRLLPPRSAVSLQEWVERRMPGEVKLGTDASGRVTLVPLAAEPDKLAAVSEPKPKAVSVAGPPVDPEAWFRGLPLDSFSPEEEKLRATMAAFLSNGPVPVAQAARDPEVMAAARACLPRSVLLPKWVERRIGGEVQVVDDNRVPTFRLAPAGKDERREAFFDSLPAESFSPEEEKLRSAIFDFLATWKSRELANLSHVGSDKTVQQARAKLLPQGLALRDWIERRIGAELELRPDRKGQLVVHLTAAARPFVNQRFQELEGDGTEGREGREGREAPEAREGRDPMEARNDFFEGLPEDELLPAELDLREALLAFLDARAQQHREPPVLADAGQDKAIQRCKAALLPHSVNLQSWIERRIGAEVVTRPHANGQVQICLRGARRSRRAGKGAPEEEPPAGTPEEREAEREAVRSAAIEKREQFFAELLPDGFAAEEEGLREALLSFLERWEGPDAPTLSNAGGDPEVRDARAAFLPKGCGVSLREWIDRRIGGEVETSCPEPNGNQVAFGLRGQLDPDAAARAVRKRKAEGPGGRAEGKGARRQQRYPEDGPPRSAGRA